MPETSPESVQDLQNRLGARQVRHRLSRYLTQNDLARAAGISLRTLARLENGEPTQFESLLLTLIALGLEDGLDHLVPEVTRSPIQLLDESGRERLRATGKRKSRTNHTKPWTWDDES
jgi:transcriptional regulator with XRE-family HTH domain